MSTQRTLVTAGKSSPLFGGGGGDGGGDGGGLRSQKKYKKGCVECMFIKNWGLAKWGIRFHTETHFFGKLVSIFFKFVVKHITCNTKAGDIR